MPPITTQKRIDLHPDIEERRGPRRTSYRARVRWYDEHGKRHSQSRAFPDRQAALDWIAELTEAADKGLTPDRFAQTLADYGATVLDLALRGLEPKTTVPYLAGWRHRIVPA